MKLNLQKLLSCLLAVCLLLPVTALTAAALPKMPIVYVHGENAVYATKEDGTRYAPREEFADELIAEVVPALAPDFAKAMLSGDYTEWSAKALEAMGLTWEKLHAQYLFQNLPAQRKGKCIDRIFSAPEGNLLPCFFACQQYDLQVRVSAGNHQQVVNAEGSFSGHTAEQDTRGRSCAGRRHGLSDLCQRICPGDSQRRAGRL